MFSVARLGRCSACSGEEARWASGCSWGLFWEPAFLPALSLTAPSGEIEASRCRLDPPGDPRPVWATGRRPSQSPTPLAAAAGTVTGPGLSCRGARPAGPGEHRCPGTRPQVPLRCGNHPRGEGLHGPGRERRSSLWEGAVLSLRSASSLAVGRVSQKRCFKVEK